MTSLKTDDEDSQTTVNRHFLCQINMYVLEKHVTLLHTVDKTADLSK